MNLSYRSEIDGLRALAVTTVVLFHAKIPGFENGFVGVDIFFVISGFLITSIIAKQQLELNFSYSRFLIRRARRILPALIVVMLSCIPFAYWLMLPDPLENFGQSLVATTFSANNILLWLTTSYWDLASEFKPLLHTWSLGVEEQFYIAYPLLLLSLLRLKARLIFLVLGALAVLSLLAMINGMTQNQASAFYLLHARAWQLLVGGMAGIATTRFGVGRNPKLATLGIILIFASLVYWPWSDYPRVVAVVLATFGSAFFLLWANEHDAVAWLFTRRPVIFVGLVSYSFYLWHQPVLAFLRISQFNEPGPLLNALGIGLSFGLSVLSWRYIETPFRSPQKTNAYQLTSIVAIGGIITTLAGTVFYTTAGLPYRLHNIGNIGAAGATIEYNERIRHLLPRQSIAPNQERPLVLIAGNSFARDFSNVIIEAGLGSHLTLLYRDDMSTCASEWNAEERQLMASLDMLIFASGNYNIACSQDLIAQAEYSGILIRFVGPKHFGENLNPLVRYSSEERSRIKLKIPNDVEVLNKKLKGSLGNNFVDLIGVLSDDGSTIRIANDDGVLLTTDRVHFSKAGAAFIAPHLPTLIPELYSLADNSEANGEGR